MRKIVWIVLLALCMPFSSFGYMESRLFCRINQQSIVVSINPKDGFKCQSYIAYIEQTMRTNARELYILQGYINNQQDVAYRTQVKQDKLANIDALQALRLNIIASMQNFEFSLLRKSVDYFVLRTTPYKEQLLASLSKLSALSGTQSSQIQRLVLLMSGQIQTLDKIEAVQTIEELIPLLNGYVYFREQIGGKFD